MTEVRIRRTHCGQTLLRKTYVDPSIGKTQRIGYTVKFWVLGFQDSDSVLGRFYGKN